MRSCKLQLLSLQPSWRSTPIGSRQVAQLTILKVLGTENKLCNSPKHPSLNLRLQKVSSMHPSMEVQISSSKAQSWTRTHNLTLSISDPTSSTILRFRHRHSMRTMLSIQTLCLVSSLTVFLHHMNSLVLMPPLLTLTNTSIFMWL